MNYRFYFIKSEQLTFYTRRVRLLEEVYLFIIRTQNPYIWDRIGESLFRNIYMYIETT